MVGRGSSLNLACGFGFYGLAVIVAVVGLFVLTVLGFVTGRGRSGPDDRRADDQQ